MKSTLDRIWKSIQRPCFEFAQKSLYLRPELFNGIQIGTIRWNINISNTGTVQQIFRYLCMVRLHIIHYENRIAVQMRKQISFQKLLKPLYSRST
mgnify:CR=1 FL=1